MRDQYSWVRRGVAAVLDVTAAVILAYATFRLAITFTPCADESNCAPLAPAAILGSLLGVALYFGVGQLLWGRTPAQRLLGLTMATSDDS